jgi:phosphatidylglycerol---prolipoprotein diacylglyceryl transferase
VHQVAFEFGGFSIYWYGVLVAMAFLIGIWTASRRAILDNLPPERIVDLGPWLILGALVGARLLYVIYYWQEDFAGGPWWEIFMIRKGGLVFYGGLLGASAAAVLYIQARQLPLWRISDILAPSIALGHVFGRLGCLMNGCCYGHATNLPWAISFPHDHPTFPSLIHPTQIYESVLNLGLYLGLAWLFRRKAFPGQVFATYLIGYSILRFNVEFFRGDYGTLPWAGWLTPAQLFSLLILASGLVLWWKLNPRKPS